MPDIKVEVERGLGLFDTVMKHSIDITGHFNK